MGDSRFRDILYGPTPDEFKTWGPRWGRRCGRKMTLWVYRMPDGREAIMRQSRTHMGSFFSGPDVLMIGGSGARLIYKVRVKRKDRARG